MCFKLRIYTTFAFKSRTFVLYNRVLFVITGLIYHGNDLNRPNKYFCSLQPCLNNNQVWLYFPSVRFLRLATMTGKTHNKGQKDRMRHMNRVTHVSIILTTQCCNLVHLNESCMPKNFFNFQCKCCSSNVGEMDSLIACSTNTIPCTKK